MKLQRLNNLSKVTRPSVAGIWTQNPTLLSVPFHGSRKATSLSHVVCTDSCFNNSSVFQILIPPKGLFTKLKKEAENPREVLDQVNSSSYYTHLLMGQVILCGFSFTFGSNL